MVEYAYNEYANASQRLSLLEDFYGPSFQLFKVSEYTLRGSNPAIFIFTSLSKGVNSGRKESARLGADSFLTKVTPFGKVFFI